MKVAVTGANGFIGGHTVARLKTAGHQVRALVRNPDRNVDGADETVRLPNLSGDMDDAALDTALGDIDAVVHLAAHVHVMRGAPDERVFMDVNVAGSVKLMRAAGRAGVHRFVFISSVKAAGERSADIPLRAEDPAAPEDAYGRSKLAAEQALAEAAADEGLSLVSLRPTFVYGHPPVGNFRTVINAVRKGMPLPLAGIRNRRDMIYAGNLADAVRVALTASDLGPGPYFLSDGEPVSTPDLFRRTAAAYGGKARLFPMPASVLALAGALAGRGDAVKRLTGNLEVDSTPFRRDAGWQAPYNMQQGLEIAAAGFAASQQADRDET